MRKFIFGSCVVIVVSCAVLFMGCEWQSSDGFNTSQGAGADVNFSGTYKSTSGSYIVASNITQLTISQAGNSIQVWDNNGNTYEGSVGSPGILGETDSVSGTYSAGATMAQSQINFSGYGSSSSVHDDVTFVGTVHAVAVNDVNSVTTGSSTNITVVTVETNGADVTTSTITPTDTTISHTYTLTGANTQYVLEGTWSVGNGSNYNVSMIAAGGDGSFTVN